jgi:hypothetical protein
MRTIPLLILAVGLGATACTGDVLEPGAPEAPVFDRAADPPYVPFRLAVTDGNSIAAPGGRCGPFPMITVSIEATATGTHLGRSTVSQSHCQNAFDPTLAFFDGEFTDTGADGSSIFGTYEGHLEPTVDPTRLAIVGVFEIAGGTRRLAGARGSGNATGVLEAATGRASLLLEGTIAH